MPGNLRHSCCYSTGGKRTDVLGELDGRVVGQTPDKGEAYSLFNRKGT